MKELYFQKDVGMFLQRRDGFISVEGTEDGMSSAVLAGVHGNEKGGIKAFERILPHLVLDSGKVQFGYGNPRAIARGERHTDANLNRMFRPAEELSVADRATYEFRRSRRMMPYLYDADTLLDLHGTRNPKTLPFAICEENGMYVARELPVEIVVSGFDKFEPGGTDHFMNRNGRTGICIESGYNEDEETTDRAEEAVIAFLDAQGHIDRPTVRRRQRGFRVYDMHVTQANFTRARAFDDFSEVHEGEALGIDGDTVLTAPEVSVTLFLNREIDRPGDEAYLLAKPVELTVFDAKEAPNATPPVILL